MFLTKNNHFYYRLNQKSCPANLILFLYLSETSSFGDNKNKTYEKCSLKTFYQLQQIKNLLELSLS